MANRLKNNSLACGLLGIIIGSGGTLCGQALLSNHNIVNNFVSSKHNTDNFDVIPYDPNGDVYITPHGTKYHLQYCYTLNRAKKIQQVNSYKAEEEGLEPCSKCH